MNDWSHAITAVPMARIPQTELDALIAERDALVAALHPGLMPKGVRRGEHDPRWFVAPDKVWNSTWPGEWCDAANKYEAVTGRKVDE